MEELRNEINTSSFLTCLPKERTSGFYLNNSSSRANFVAIAVVNSLLASSGAVLNITFIITVFKKRSLHTVPNTVLLALSVTDFITCLVVIPSQVYSVALLSQKKLRCDVYLWAYALSGTGLSTSLLLIIVMSTEKYLAICYPFWHGTNVTKLKVFLVCIILAVANIVRYIISFSLGLIQFSRAGTGFIYVTAHIMFFWCQIKIFAVLFKIKRRIGHEQMPSTGEFQTKWKNSFAMLFICLSFILCYLPSALFLVYRSVVGGSQFSYQYVEPWFFVISGLSTCISPVVYYWRLPEIRQEAWKLFLTRSS